MIRVFVVEDNQRQLAATMAKVEGAGFQMAGYARTSIDALSGFEKSQADVILMDINLAQDEEGIVLAREIKKKSGVPIIFTTALNSVEVAKRAIDIRPSGYLIKPINPVELKANIELAVKNIEGETHGAVTSIDPTPDYITVRVGQKLNRIYFKDIVLVRVDSKNYLVMVDTDNRYHVLRESLKRMIDSILPKYFFRSHNSYAVSLNHIKFIDEQSQRIFLTGDNTAPIGRAFKEQVYKLMNIK